MAATTSLACIDYIAFKFGCQSISRDLTDSYYKSATQKKLYGHLINNNLKIDRWFNDFTNFDLRQEAKSTINFEKQFRISTELRNNNIISNLGSTGNIFSFAQKEEVQTAEGIQAEKTVNDTFTLARPKEQGQHKPKLTEITNQISLANTEQDEIELCSDSEQELSQIYSRQDHQKLTSIESNDKLLDASLLSRKRTFRSDDEQIDNKAKRRRPSIDFYTMRSSRRKANSRLEAKKTHFIPIASSML